MSGTRKRIYTARWKSGCIIYDVPSLRNFKLASTEMGQLIVAYDVIMYPSQEHGWLMLRSIRTWLLKDII